MLLTFRFPGMTWFWLLVWCAACSANGTQGDAGFGDAGRDAEDASDGSDPDGGDDAEEPLWPWCPDPVDEGDPGWDGTLEITGQALYCSRCVCGMGISDPVRDVEADYQRKSQVRFVPASIRIPTEAGTYPFTLPVCVRFREAGTQPEASGEATLTLAYPDTRFHLSITQPMRTAAGEEWVLTLDRYAPVEALTEPLLLDGVFHNPRFENHAYWEIYLVHLDDYRLYSSCNFEGVAEQIRTVRFQGGQVALRTRVDTVEAGGQAIFLEATGELDGLPFGQDDFFQLPYATSLHFFLEHFGVLFDDPMGPAWGLRAEHLSSRPGEDPRFVLLDVDRSELEEREILEVIYP